MSKSSLLSWMLTVGPREITLSGKLIRNRLPSFEKYSGCAPKAKAWFRSLDSSMMKDSPPLAIAKGERSLGVPHRCEACFSGASISGK